MAVAVFSALSAPTPARTMSEGLQHRLLLLLPPRLPALMAEWETAGSELKLLPYLFLLSRALGSATIESKAAEEQRRLLFAFNDLFDDLASAGQVPEGRVVFDQLVERVMYATRVVRDASSAHFTVHPLVLSDPVAEIDLTKAATRAAMQAAAAHSRKQADVNSLPASRGGRVPQQDTLLTDVILKQYETRKSWTSSQAQPISLQQLPNSASSLAAPPTNPLKAVQHALYGALRDAAKTNAKTCNDDDDDDDDDRAFSPLEQTQPQPQTLRQCRVYVESMVALPPPLDALLICDSPATAQAGLSLSSSANEGRRLGLWRISDGECSLRKVLQENGSLLTCAEMLPTERYTFTSHEEQPVRNEVEGGAVFRVATASVSCDLTIWTLIGQGEILSLAGQREVEIKETLSSLAFAPIPGAKGSLFGGSVGGRIFCWDVATWTVSVSTARHDACVSALQPLPSLEILASASHDSTLRLWRLRTLAPHNAPLRGHTQGVLAFCFDAAHHLLVSGGADRAVCVWNPALGEKLSMLHGHQHAVTAVRLATSYIVTGDTSCAFRVWDGDTLRCIQEFNALHSLAALGVHLSTTPSRASLMSMIAPDPSKPTLLALASGRLHLISLTDLHEGQEAYTAVLVSATLKLVVAATRHALRAYDAVSGALRSSFPFTTDTPISAIMLDHTERNVIVGEHSGKLAFVSVSTGLVVRQMPPHESEVVSLAVVTGWPPPTSSSSNARGKPISAGAKPISAGAKPISAGAKSISAGARRAGLTEAAQHGALLVSAAADHLVHISSIRRNTLLCTVNLNSGSEVSCVAASSGLVAIATVSEDSSAAINIFRVWDAHTIRPYSTCQTEASAVCTQSTDRTGSVPDRLAGVTAIAFLSKHKLVTADEDACIVLWAVAPNKSVAVMRFTHVNPMHKAMRQHQSNLVKPASNAEQLDGEGSFAKSLSLTRDALAPAITSLVLDEDRESAFTGDETGYVCMWQLGKRHVTASMGAESTSAPTTQPDSVAICTKSTENRATNLISTSCTCSPDKQCSHCVNASSGASTSPSDAHRAEPLACWRAHKDAISSLSIILSERSPSDGQVILVSASLDSTVRSWAIELDSGSVRLCGGLGGWELPVLIHSQYEREEKRLKQLAEDMKTFRPPAMPQKAKHLLNAFASSQRRAPARSQ